MVTKKKGLAPASFKMRRKGASAGAKRQRRLGFPASTPEAEGWSSAPLSQLSATTKLEIQNLGALAGASHVVLHRGRCVFTCAEGYANRSRKVRFGPDTICALHGNSKPLVVAAFLTLVDEGRVRLSDPVLKHWPLFPKTVATPSGACRNVKEGATMQDLLTMSSGLGYTCEDVYADIMKRVRQHKVTDLATFSDELAKVPLMFRPGKRYEYGYSTDILGRVCEVVSGEPLEKFVQRRLLKPLGMKDTYFVVPRSKRSRISELYDAGEEVSMNKRRRTGLPYDMKLYKHPDSAPGIMSAGGGVTSYNDAGMFSTARDYARFCQMLLDGGVGINGRRVLSAGIVRSLWTDGLAKIAGPDGRAPGWNDCMGKENRPYWDRVGWSLLNTHVTFNEQPKPKSARRAVAMFMGGGGGTYWVIDWKRKTVAITFTQCFGGRKAFDGSDGHGPRANDAAPFVLAAADGVQDLLTHDYGKFGPPSCDPRQLIKRLVVKVPVKSGATSSASK